MMGIKTPDGIEIVIVIKNNLTGSCGMLFLLKHILCSEEIKEQISKKINSGNNALELGIEYVYGYPLYFFG